MEQLLAAVIAELTRNGMDVAEEAVQLLGAFGLNQWKMAESNYGQDGMVIILSDVHLDNPAVMCNLNLLFQGFTAM
eukprot:7010656-Ditylum_brightwellii.AAC.1